jgi:hypothetical protein
MAREYDRAGNPTGTDADAAPVQASPDPVAPHRESPDIHEVRVDVFTPATGESTPASDASAAADTVTASAPEPATPADTTATDPAPGPVSEPAPAPVAVPGAQPPGKCQAIDVDGIPCHNPATVTIGLPPYSAPFYACATHLEEVRKVLGIGG